MGIVIAIFFIWVIGAILKDLGCQRHAPDYFIQHYVVKHYGWQHNVEMRVLECLDFCLKFERIPPLFRI